MDNRKWHITPDSILLFDLDGTLLNTDTANFLAYKEAIKIVKDKEIQEKIVASRFTRGNLWEVIPDLTKEEYCKIIHEKEKCYNLFLHETKKLEAADILCKYFATNRTILVSTCRKDRALLTLSYHGLLNKLNNFVFYEENDIFPNKFVKALSILQLYKNQVVLFENDDLQLKYAREAGIRYLNPIII